MRLKQDFFYKITEALELNTDAEKAIQPLFETFEKFSDEEPWECQLHYPPLLIRLSFYFVLFGL